MSKPISNLLNQIHKPLDTSLFNISKSGSSKQSSTKAKSQTLLVENKENPHSALYPNSIILNDLEKDQLFKRKPKP